MTTNSLSIRLSLSLRIPKPIETLNFQNVISNSIHNLSPEFNPTGIYESG